MPIFKLIRAITRPIILAAERCCYPEAIQRDPEIQVQVDQATANMVIYQYLGCPFCMITRRQLHRLNLSIELRDALNDPEHKASLVSGGGKDQVPCLHIQEDDQDIWMYESADIIDYLDKRFGDRHDGQASKAA